MLGSCVAGGAYLPVLSDTVLMTEGVDLFADRWRVELADPRMGRRIELAYDVKVLPEPVA